MGNFKGYETINMRYEKKLRNKNKGYIESQNWFVENFD